jgi:hypothetical protein
MDFDTACTTCNQAIGQLTEEQDVHVGQYFQCPDCDDLYVCDFIDDFGHSVWTPVTVNI